MTYLRAIRIRNFKAVRDSGLIRLTSLTAFVGNNGAGKSSLMEALETYQNVVTEGVDAAMARFNGMEHVRHKAAKYFVQQGLSDPEKQKDPISIYFRAAVPDIGQTRVTLRMNVKGKPGQFTPYIQSEVVKFGDTELIRDFRGAAQTYGEGRSFVTPVDETRQLYSSLDRWQFLSLNPDVMGAARAQQRVRGQVRLLRDGSNLAGYLLDLSQRAPTVLNGIVEAMQFILPYAKDIRSNALDSEIDRRVLLDLAEANFRIPGWLFSSGTLRALAIIALLRDPDPPPVIFIEEIENGLDPRTVGLLVEEIRKALKSKKTQVICTTHSPYLLDCLPLRFVVVVERGENGSPMFWRPDDDQSLTGWKDDFATGHLYTMGKLSRGVSVKSSRRGEAKG